MNIEPALSQILEIVKISESIRCSLESALQSIPKSSIPFFAGWIQFFQNVQNQFQIFRDSYSEKLIAQYSNYIKEVSQAVNTFQNEGPKYPNLFKSLHFEDSLNRFHRCIQTILDFIKSLLSSPVDIFAALKKSLTILQKPQSKFAKKMKNKEATKELNRITESISELNSNKDTLFDDYETTKNKLTALRSSIFLLYDIKPKPFVCLVYNYISHACYHFLSFSKATNETSQSILRFLVLFNSFIIHFHMITSKDTKDFSQIELAQWNQFLSDSYSYYSSLSAQYNKEDILSNIQKRKTDNASLIEFQSQFLTLLKTNKNEKITELAAKLFESLKNVIEHLKVEEFPPNQARSFNSQRPLSSWSPRSSVYSSFYDGQMSYNGFKTLPTSKSATPITTKHSTSQNALISSDLSDTDELHSNHKAAEISSSPTKSEWNGSTSMFSIPVIQTRSRKDRRSLSSSHSMTHLSLSPQLSSNSSFGYRIPVRKPILISPKSPIKIKPSGNHITFNFGKNENKSQNKKIKLAIPNGIDRELLMPFLPNPAFFGWSINTILKKISYSQPPIIKYRSSKPKFHFSAFDFHLLPFKTATTHTSEELMNLNLLTNKSDHQQIANEEEEHKKKQKKRKIGIHFRKKENNIEPTENTPLKSFELDVNSMSVIKDINLSLRKCSKDLKTAKTNNDQYQLLQFVNEWYKPVYTNMLMLVQLSQNNPNNEFVVDGIREYEHIRIEFDEILNEIEFNQAQTLIESVAQSMKQLSLITIALSLYLDHEQVAFDSCLSAGGSKILTYLSSYLNPLQILVECQNVSDIIACSDFLFTLRRAILSFTPIFSDLESIVQKSILSFAVDSILNTLKQVAVFLHHTRVYLTSQKSTQNESKSESDSEHERRSSRHRHRKDTLVDFTEEEIREQISKVILAADAFLNSDFVVNNQDLYITMISDILYNCLNTTNIFHPLYFIDITEIGNVIENTFIQILLNEQTPKPQLAHFNSNTLMIYSDSDESSDEHQTKSAKSDLYESKTMKSIEAINEILVTHELRECMTLHAAVRSLQFMLNIKQCNALSSTKIEESSDASETDEVFDHDFKTLVLRNQFDFTELADSIQNSINTNKSILSKTLSQHWFDSIYQITTNLATLSNFTEVLINQTFLYSQVDLYFNLLLDTVQFFNSTAKSTINISPLFGNLVSDIKNTQLYTRTKPYLLIDNSNANQYIKYPLFEKKFDLDKYKYGFFVDRTPLFKNQSSFITEILFCSASKMKHPISDPHQCMEYLLSLFKKLTSAYKQIGKLFQKHQNKQKAFISFFVNKINSVEYIKENCVRYYEAENESRLICLFSFGDFLSKYIEIASVFFDTEIEMELQKKRKKEKKLNSSHQDDYSSHSSEEEEEDSANEPILSDEGYAKMKELKEKAKLFFFTLSIISKKNAKLIKSEFNALLKTKPLTVRALFENSQTFFNKCFLFLKQLRNHMEKYHQRIFNNSLITKSSNEMNIVSSDDENGQPAVSPLHNSHQLPPLPPHKQNESSNLMLTEDINDSETNPVDSSFKEEISDNCKSDPDYQKIRSMFQSIIDEMHNLQHTSIANNSKADQQTTENIESKDKTSDIENEESGDSESADTEKVHQSESSTTGDNNQNDPKIENLSDVNSNCYLFENIYRNILALQSILEKPAEAAFEQLKQIALQLQQYASRALLVPYSEKLSIQLLSLFDNLLEEVGDRYGKYAVLQKQSNALQFKTVINETINQLIQAINQISKTILQRELIENTKDPELLIRILSQNLVDDASMIEPTSDDYSFVLRIIKTLSLAILNAFDNNPENVKQKIDTVIGFDVLKMFVASFDYFMTIMKQQMSFDVLSDEMLKVLGEFEKLPLHIPGCYQPQICLRFLLNEADNE